jgi:hypothetical protein
MNCVVTNGIVAVQHNHTPSRCHQRDFLQTAKPNMIKFRHTKNEPQGPLVGLGGQHAHTTAPVGLKTERHLFKHNQSGYH